MKLELNKFALALIPAAVLWTSGSVALAGENAGELDVVADRVPAVLEMIRDVEDAAANPQPLSVKGLLSALPVADADLSRLDAGFPDGVDAGCTDGDCTIEGTGRAGRALLQSDDPAFRNVAIGLRTAVVGRFKARATPAGLVVDFCEIEGVFFARGPFRLNLEYLRFTEKPDGGVLARYELSGSVSGDINCD